MSRITRRTSSSSSTRTIVPSSGVTSSSLVTRGSAGMALVAGSQIANVVPLPTSLRTSIRPC